jgi:hypothetical protein
MELWERMLRHGQRRDGCFAQEQAIDGLLFRDSMGKNFFRKKKKKKKKMKSEQRKKKKKKKNEPVRCMVPRQD